MSVTIVTNIITMQEEDRRVYQWLLQMLQMSFQCKRKTDECISDCYNCYKLHCKRKTDECISDCYNCYKCHFNAKGRQTSISVSVTIVINVITLQEEDRRVYQ